MNIWDRFLDSLDSPGGHIFVLVLLLALGYQTGHMELTAAAMGALFALLRTTQSNHTRQNGKEPTP